MAAEQELGIGPPPKMPFRPSPEDDAARAERIRQARLAQQGREAGVFFQLTSRTATDAPPAESPTQISSAPDRNPFDGLRAERVDRGLGLDIQSDQNLQGRKLDFVNQDVDKEIYNPHALQDPASPYQVMAGTIIDASLVTGINSDLPGRVIAQVTENVYDTRIPVHDIAEMVANGDTVANIVAAYPTLSEGHVEASRVYAEAYPRRGRPRHEPIWRKNVPRISIEVAFDKLPRDS